MTNVPESLPRRDVLTGTGAVIIAAGFLAGVYFPGQMRRDSTERELAAAVRTIRIAPARARELERLKRSLRETQTFVDAMRPRRAPPRVSDLVALSSNLAQTSNLSVVRFEPGTPTRSIGPTEIVWQIEMACQGNARAWAAFLLALETAPRFITVQEVVVSASDDTSELATGTVRFAVHADSEKPGDCANFDDSFHRQSADSSEQGTSREDG